MTETDIEMKRCTNENCNAEISFATLHFYSIVFLQRYIEIICNVTATLPIVYQRLCNVALQSPVLPLLLKSQIQSHIIKSGICKESEIRLDKVLSDGNNFALVRKIQSKHSGLLFTIGIKEEFLVPCI